MSIELFAFYSNESWLQTLNQTNIKGYIVDLERKGKELRQQLYNTQVSEHNLDHLVKVRRSTDKWIICRINNHQQIGETEIEEVIDSGANELLIPMIKTVEEVETALNLVNGRAKVSIMLETVESLKILEAINRLPLERCYVGLNDLSIQQRSNNIFLPLTDGTIEEIASSLHKKLGVAGLTHPSLGSPIPCKWLIDIMKRNNCSFGVLRRSFYKDARKYAAQDIIDALFDEFQKEMNSSISEKEQLAFIRNVKM